MITNKTLRVWFPLVATVFVLATLDLRAQTLINVDFGVGNKSAKTGFAGTGQSTNDAWNLFRYYDPRYTPGMPLIFFGEMKNLKLADGNPTDVAITVTNAPGVWGNATGDSMYDTYMFAQNGSNIVIRISHLPPGRYNFYLYGHADADASAEQNSIFKLRAAGTNYGPSTATGSPGWKATTSWQEGNQYVVFRDVTVSEWPVFIEIAPGPNGIAVLNGLQISSRGTSPPRFVENGQPQQISGPTNLVVHQIRYDGSVDDNEAKFTADVEFESFNTNEVSTVLFQGDVAVTPLNVPEGVRVARAGKDYRLFVAKRGAYKLSLNVVAKIKRTEPWNEISFSGPSAAIASIHAQGKDGVEIQLLSGTAVEGEKAKSQINAFLNADRVVSLRWQSKGAEVTRKALVNVTSSFKVVVSATLARITSTFQYEMLQAPIARLRINIPKEQSLTKLEGEQIRDWKVENGVLVVEFIKPVERNYTLTLLTEQPVTGSAEVTGPQPMDVERETGSALVFVDDAQVDIQSTSGLRQINAVDNALAAYRFYARPWGLALKIKAIEPLVKSTDRIDARLEDSRFIANHNINLHVEKAGIYSAVLAVPSGLTVVDVRGEGVEEWKTVDGSVTVSFTGRVLGDRKVEVQLEKSLKVFPASLSVEPIRVAGATRETTQVVVTALPGLRVKTAELNGLREVPINQLRPERNSTDGLGFETEQGSWKLTLNTERLPARVSADVFNLLTIGDGIVGGSATVRYTLINQGVQEFRVSVPSHWKNIEFTGANIRGKEKQTNSTSADFWIVSLQEKAWGGYTLVVTYDYQFDPKHATLDGAGLHVLNAEQENGSVAITTAANLKLEPKLTDVITMTNSAGMLRTPLRQIDSSELDEVDAALINRPVLLAYRYTGDDYHLHIDVTRHQEEQLLDAVADRTQITSVITEAGQMLTQASFMVKNNDRQFQRFQLPARADFWSCYVNGQTSKAERDGDWLLVPLPRTANRNEAFAVDLVYAQKTDALHAKVVPESVEFLAPKTDVPNTYAEWEVYVPETRRVSGFGGTMTVSRGTIYDFSDAFRRFTDFYKEVLQEHGGMLVGWTIVMISVIALILQARRSGSKGAIQVLIVLFILGILASMMVPNFTRARMSSLSSAVENDMRLIDGAIQQYAVENRGKMPATLNELQPYAGRGGEKALIDPASGEPYVYSGSGKDLKNPNAILAYSPTDRNGRTVLTGHGIVHMSGDEFAAALENESRDASSALADTGVASLGVSQAVTASAGLGGTTTVTDGVAPAATPNSSFLVNGAASPTTTFGFTTRGFVEQAKPLLTTQPVAAPPKVAGIRSIHIDIPRRGHAFTFTKVLNITGDPLEIKMSIINAGWYAAMRSSVQLIAFLSGLIILWRIWRQARTYASARDAFWLALGLALTLGSVIALAITTRELHLFLILLVPVTIVAALIWGSLKLWARTSKAVAGTSTGLPPAVASIVLFVFLGTFGLNAKTVRNSDSVPGPTITTATYVGNIGQQSAQFEGTLTMTSAGTNEIVSLFGSDVALQEFQIVSGEAKLMQDGDGKTKSTALLPKPGEATVKVKFLVKLSGNVSKRELNFELPSALSSKLTATIDEAEADVEFPTAVAFTRATAGQRTRVEAVVGSEDRVELQWTPRVKRAAETAATVFVENRSLATLGNGALSLRTTMNYQIAQGELRQLRIKLPAKCRLLKVEGESLRTWELKSENGNDVLIVELLKGVSPTYKLTLETERLLENLPTSVSIDLPHALDVKRESGVIGVRSTEELSVNIEAASDVQRVDTSEFSEAEKKGGEILTAYRFITPSFGLTVRAEPVRPQIEAVVRNFTLVDTERVHLSARVAYTIKKAGVFELQLALPDSYLLESVTGENIGQWKTNGTTLVVSFKDRVVGNYNLSLELSKPNVASSKSTTVSVAGIQPLSTAQIPLQKLTGFVAVSGDVGIGIKALSFDGLTEVPANTIDGSAFGAGALAYKFVNSKPGKVQDWKLDVGIEFMQPWIRAEIANIFTVNETLVKGRAVVRYEIQNAPAKEFRFQIPTSFSNVEITGANIRRRDQNDADWRVELQNKVHGTVTLYVTWDQARISTNSIELVGISAAGVERETGTVIVKAKSTLQIQERQVSGELAKIDARELPDWSGVNASASGNTEAAVLVYRYVRPDYRLTIDANRFDEAAVLQALIDQAHLTTVVADDGQVMTELSFNVRNNGLQHLEIELPNGDKVWSAFVGGQPVRPALREGKLLLPLEDAANPTDELVSVELTYVGREKFPNHRGAVNLISPKVDVPLKNARWDLYLPPDYRYDDFAGTMNLQHDAATVVRTFSLSEYRVMEAEKKQARQADAKSVLSKSKSSASGNRHDIARYKADDFDDDVSKRELGRLQKEAEIAQSSNLMNAEQNAAIAANGGQALDKEIAQKQVKKLQEAQELGVTRIQPLRVNLPTRGVHYGFNQVLQTEVRKAMTVHFSAANLRATNLFGRMFAIAGAFVALWVVAGMVLARRREQAS